MSDAARYEYRLRWQRVGLRPTSAIYQTLRGVTEKAERMLALDETKGDETAAFADMPDLVWMRLERRVVGDWCDDRTYDVPEPNPESARESVSMEDIPW